ncbi:hypothetical protein HAZT_HAZT010924 [Hyalella azteca]|nr:hypothetical protein HAZT_HAZT010924 [Hyalella azteca]
MDTFDKILREQYIEYTKNLDVTSYSDGVRQTHNPSGRAYAAVVWDYFSNGCSLRLLNPQTFHEPVWRTLSVLQELFGSFCGANIYLTPAGTQGFAPHWDDIEAFVLQLEGKKRWRVYNPRSAEEVLPRYSSPNLTQEEIGEPIIDVVLEPGDTLYFPRGYIHQAEAVSDTYSLHITISMYQKNAWVDVLEKIFSPASLNGMAEKDVSLRKGLPIGCIGYMGSTAAQIYANDVWKNERCSNISNLRKKFKEEVMSRVSSMLTEDVLDRAMDEFARQFVRVALPPCPTEADKECTVEYDGEYWHSTMFRGRAEIEPETKIKLLGSSTLRVVQEWGDAKDEYRVYHSVENSREYEGREEQFVVVDKKHLPAVQHLIIMYPRYTAIEDLPLATLEDKMTVAMSLWEQRLVITETPLPSDDYSSSNESNSSSE